MTEQQPAPPAFEMSDAARYAFAKRERRFVLLRAALAFLVLNAILYGVFAYLARDAFADYMAWATQIAESGGFTPGTPPPPPPQTVIEAVPMALLVGVLFLVLMAAYEAASLRWLVRSEAGGGLFGLKLDADTARVFLVYLTWIGVVIGVYLAVLLFGVVLSLVLAIVRAPVGLFLALAPLMLLCLMAYVGVRFAPAAAATIATQRYAFFRAWTVTHGRFWSLFGAFAFILIIYLVATLVLYAIYLFAIMGGAMSTVMESGGRPDPEAMRALAMTPGAMTASILLNIVMIAAYQVTLIAMFGVNAFAAAFAQREGRLAAR